MYKPIKHRARTDDELKEHILHSITHNNECWEWNGSRCRAGYGRMKHKGKLWEVHRLSYTIFNGDIPDGLEIRHTCDNPCCCNPEHLITGTHQQNIQDGVDRQRHIRGEDIAVSKLTPDDVKFIRDIYDTHIYKNYSPHNREWSLERLSEMFDISTRSCWNVCRRVTWTHIP